MTVFAKDIPGSPNEFSWTSITADDCPETYIPPGTYIMEVSGTWGGASVGLLASLKQGASTALASAGTPWAATANTGLISIGPLSSSYVKPKITGGSSYNLSLYLRKVD